MHRSVWENVLIAHHLLIKANFLELLLNRTRAKSGEAPPPKAVWRYWTISACCR